MIFRLALAFSLHNLQKDKENLRLTAQAGKAMINLGRGTASG